MPIFQTLGGIAKRHGNENLKLCILGKTLNEISQMRTPLWSPVIRPGCARGHPTLSHPCLACPTNSFH